jgi:hypothetical protein
MGGMYSEWAIGFILILVLWPFALLAFTKLGRRFSIRTLLIVTAVVAFVLCAYVVILKGN